jgi:hypothetical protein
LLTRDPSPRASLLARAAPGVRFNRRFPLIVEALAWPRARSFIIDGEAVACGEDGIALFEHSLSPAR